MLCPRRFYLLFLFATAMPVSFAIWAALLNNFVVQVSNFSGVEIGWLQTIREIPGFLAVGVILLLIWIREQSLAILSLIALGLATALTGFFPSFIGLLLTTLLGSFGFHYFETVNQSLQLQWIPKKNAPWIIGLLIAAGSGASLVAYSVLVFGWERFNFSFNLVYVFAGSTTIFIALICYFLFPIYDNTVKQKLALQFKKKYWLYYLLQFFAGARRQIFVVFASFMMVEKFGLEVHELTALFLVNFLLNIIFAPIMGKVVQFFGERIYLNSPSSYFISEINEDLLGSYSFLITSALISNLFLLKSIILYFLFTPPPILRDVILPWLFLPPVECFAFVSVLYGLSFDKCFFDTKTVPL